MRTLTFRFILFLVCLIPASFIYAAKGELSSGVIKGKNIKTSKTTQLSLGLDKIPGITYYDVIDKVVLKYTDDASLYLNTDWKVQVKVEISSFDEVGNVFIEPKQVLLSLQGYTGTAKSIDVDLYSFKGAHKIQLRVIDVQTKDLPTELPDVFSLELMIEHESYFHSNTFTTPNMVSAHPINRSMKSIDFVWEGIAEEFDFEWTFWSSDMLDGTPLPEKPSDINRFDYQRVTLKGNRFTLHNTYDNGYIYYRVRVVERDGIHPEIRREGPWSDGNFDYITIYNIEPTKNWVSKSTFAEEGNLQITRSYVDGSLRTRQELAKLNTDNVTLITEKFYDYEGRLVVQTLPAPNSYLGSDLYFNNNFSQVNDGNKLVLLTKKDIDYSSDVCKINEGPKIAISQGAGYYYSQNNSLTRNSTAYVADAQGYPYTQTVFDLEGRPSIQAGAGVSHTLSSGHDVETFYAQPTQIQLDRMFGNEVGFAEHYSMKINKDVHDQLSFNYLDLSGKTIATSLVGDTPNNLDKLPENKVLIDVQDNFNNLNHYSPSEEAYIIETDFFVQKAGLEHIFTYSLTKEVFDYLCTSTQHDCVYDLEISITDACGRNIPDGNSITNYYTNNNATLNKIITIRQDVYTTDSLSVFFPTVGKYKIRKVLRLNQAALNQAVSDFTNSLPGKCIPSEEKIRGSYDSNAPEDECVSCEDRLPLVNNSFEQGGTTTSTSYGSNYCDVNIPGSALNCEDLLRLLKTDMGPGGQYFDNLKAKSNPDDERSNTWLEVNITSNPRDLKYIENGKEVLCSNWNEVYDHWQEDWLSQLVIYHPEYNHYLACISMQESVKFDAALRNLPLEKVGTMISSDCISSLKFNDQVDPFLSISGIDPAAVTAYLQTGDVTSDAYCLYKEALKYKAENGVEYDQSKADAWQIFVTKYGFYKKSLFDQRQPTPLKYLSDELVQDFVCDDNDPKTNGFYIRVPNLSKTRKLLTEVEGNSVKTQELQDALSGTYPNLVVNGDFEDVANFNLLTLSNTGFDSDYSYGTTSEYLEKFTRGQISVFTYQIFPNTNMLRKYNKHFTVGNSTKQLFDFNFNQDKKGHYLLGDGAIDIKDPNSFKRIWSQIIQVESGKKYNFSFFATQIGSFYDNPETTTVNESEVWNTHNPILSGVISYSNEKTTVVSQKLNYTDLWKELKGEWVCPPGVTSIELSIVDESLEPMGNDFAIDEISFKQVGSNTVLPTLTDEPFVDCMCANIDNLTALYYKENPTGTLNGANTFIVEQFNQFQSGIDVTKVAAFRANCTATPKVHPDISGLDVLMNNICNTDLGIDCAKEKESILAHNASEEYKRLKNEEIVKFINAFKAHCFRRVVDGGGLSENFEVIYKDQQYHYTLYYYDQAGNLARTVPPGGVNLLTGIDLDNVDKHRLNPTVTAYVPTNHGLITKYEYNSLNQLVRKLVPDADADNRVTNNSKGYTHYYWYDKIGRIVLSQSSKQKDVSAYSYMTYDPLGRVRQAGEITSQSFPTIAELSEGDMPDIWKYQPKEITTSVYDYPVSSTVNTYFGKAGQQHLRSRISGVLFDVNGDGTPENGSYYSYTPHGDVHTYISQRKDLAQLHTNQGIFKMEYDFDLITGKVKDISYQKGTTDQFFHHYDYDKDNRLTNVFTSKDGLLWDQDAKYFYYLHGPLARTEIGEQKVQGLDYAYTIQGWLKGMNSAVLNRSSDMGKDGYSLSATSNSNLNQFIASDAVGYVVGYNKSDYRSVGTTAVNFQQDLTSASNFRGRELFNGNISHVALAMSGTDLTPLPLQQTVYTYDQLQRFTSSTVYHSTTNYTNASSSGALGMNVSYDPMGNILTLERNKGNGTSLALDKLTYRYQSADPLTNAGLVSNRLYHVDDDVPVVQNGSLGDIKDMGTFDASNLAAANFGYDKAGNLTRDKSEGIVDIKWTSTGKIKEIIRDEKEVVNIQPDLEFQYDGFGRRICKIEKIRILDPTNPSRTILVSADKWNTSYYVHDAQGNELASYKLSYDYQQNNPTFRLNERFIYGASRLGVVDEDLLISTVTDLDANTYAYAIVKNNPIIGSSLNDLKIAIAGVSVLDPTIKYYNFGELENAINSYVSNPDYIAYKDPTNPDNQLIIQAKVLGGYSFDGPSRNLTLKGNILSVGYFTEGNLVSCGIQRVLGNKRYEVANYLGNVHAVITDRKVPVQANDGSQRVSFYYSEIVQNADYYAFGMTVGTRTSSLNSYGFAYNGMKLDNEVSGNGNSYTAEFWQYDARLGRRWNQDPVVKPWQSNYHTFSNNPVAKKDPLGNTDDWVRTDGSKDWQYDSRVQSSSDAKALYGENTEYKNDGESFKGADTKTGNAVGDVKLHSGGVMTWGGNKKAIVQDNAHVSNMIQNEWSNDESDKIKNQQQLQGRIDAINKLEQITANVFFTIGTGGVGLEATALSNLVLGGVNASGNLGAQLYANQGDWSKVDVLGVGISFGSAFLPGGSTTNIIKSSAFSAGLDASFDLYYKGGNSASVSKKFSFDYIGNKHWGVVANDMLWGVNGNLQSGLMPLGMRGKYQIGTSILTNPTNVYMNCIINNRMSNPNP